METRKRRLAQPGMKRIQPTDYSPLQNERERERKRTKEQKRATNLQDMHEEINSGAGTVTQQFMLLRDNTLQTPPNQLTDERWREVLRGSPRQQNM